MTTVTTDVPSPHAGHHPDPNESYLKTTHSLAGTETGFLSWATTLDHKRIGIMYLCVGPARVPHRRAPSRSSCASS